MSDKSKLSSFVSTAESLTGHPVVFAGNDVLHDYAGMNPEAAKIMGWPDKTDAIIIDKNQTVEEQIHDVIHETVEESEIRQGLSYHDAHVIALKAEETIKTPEQLVERVEKIEDGKKMGKSTNSPTPEFTAQYYRDAAQRQRKMAADGGTKISDAGVDSMKGYGRFKYKEPFLEKAELFESWAKNPEKYVHDTAVVDAWKKQNAFLDVFHGKSVKQIASNDEIESGGWGKNRKRPNLDNVIELHPSNGSWRNFLKDAELRETKNGVKHYISSNGHYIVLPDGEVITFYGYKGQAALKRLPKTRMAG